MKIIFIVGARPQFIKLAPLYSKLKGFYNLIIIHTGQHYDKNMSDTFFLELGISEPDYNLGINVKNHGEQTAEMLKGIEAVLLNEQPELVITFGDTNSTLAGALASAKLNIKSIHIEAGLRSFNRFMPEEINRIVSDHVSDYLFAPTFTALKNLDAEGLKNKSILTGDIMADLLLNNVSKLSDKKNISDDLYYLLTLHRPYNVDNVEKLTSILQYLDLTGKKIIFPVHPRTRLIIDNAKLAFENIIMTKPKSYMDFLALQKNCEKIITDSGGIQKEAYLLKKPCITLRSETEWVETVDSGWNLLVKEYNSELPELIKDFNPSGSHPDIFGVNVTETMFIEISKILG